MERNIQNAIKILKNGGIVIFPTDTAFGIGCRIDDEKAVAKLFGLRNRPETKAVPVLVSSLEMAKSYWQNVPDIVVDKLIRPYWPGALTIVLSCKTEKIPGLVRGGGGSLGLRMPDQKELLQIIANVGVPIVGTSANFAGEKTPYRFEDLDPELLKLVDFVLDSRLRGNDKERGGNDEMNKASTVVDCTVEPWRILRQGATKISIKY